MKILIVAHRFPPRHQTGAELYSWRLAKALLERGHEITVFTADDDLLKRNYARVVRPMGRLRVIEVQNHRLHETFAETYADPHMEREFRDVLFEVGPDIVHFQHLLHHSVHYPAMARELEIPSILTLHEYWFLCGRNGQLLQANGDRCLGPGNEKCARCLSTFMWGRRNLDLWMLRGLAGVRRLTGVDLKAQARKIRLKRLSEIDPAHVSIEAIAEMKKDLLIREARVRDMFDMVDCFLAPSEFLKERFVQYGLESERILHNDYGTELEAFDRPRVPPKPNGRIRVGFIGSIQPVKGVHLLVQAMQDLDPVRFEARIWGDLSTKPEYVAALRRQLPSHVRLAGGVPQEAI
ncbi:MAG: glycosyltransferase, partial [Salinibacterium sp.]|nr:glycosyltransferase [Salinibacterium sp.]